MLHKPDALEVRKGICHYAPCGECTLVEAVALVTSAIACCRNQGVARLLVDVTGIAGISIPTLVDRFLMMEEWAQEAKGRVVVALVARPEHIHPQKFGVAVARDLGMMADVFTSERDALKWLASHSDPASQPS